MYRTFSILLVLGLIGTAAPLAVAGPDESEATAEQTEARPIPKDVFVGAPGSRLLAAVEYAGISLDVSQQLSLEGLAGVLDTINDPISGWAVDATVEACGGDAACGGTYTGDNSANTYFMGGNISGNACQDILIQTNLVIGDNNTFCYQSAESHVTYSTEDGAFCHQTASSQSGGACGTGLPVVSFVVFLTCVSETATWYHEGTVCPGIV